MNQICLNVRGYKRIQLFMLTIDLGQQKERENHYIMYL